MELNGDIYFAHSKANCRDDKTYKNFKGDKSKSILKLNINF